jgi:hypothetical protein
MRVSHSIAGMVIIFDPVSPLRPKVLSLPLRNASPSSEGSATFGYSHILSYIMYACQFSGAGSLKRFTTDRLRNTIHAAVSVRFQWGVFWVIVI